MDLGIQGRTAAVAAASRGLGFATAQALAREGVRVAICGRDPGAIDAAAARIGDGAVGIACDVSTPEGAKRFVEQAHAALGALDILVTNCGGPPPGAAGNADPKSLELAIQANLLSMVTMIHAALPEMRERNWGRILAITSQTAREPMPFMVNSNTARAGLTAFLKTLSREVAADGVTVNSILPGGHDTERVRELGGPAIDSLVTRSPVGRLGEAEEFGHVAAFLCSRWTSNLTGTTLTVDGGSSQGLF